MANIDPNLWNNKWPKAPIIYTGRELRTSSVRLNLDVKNFITSNDELLKSIINKYGLAKSKPDDTVWAIQKWVVKYLSYKSDDDVNKCPEFWQFPFETLQSKVGDCEDGSILIASLCINAGVPAFRVKVAAGFVQAQPTAPQGGHAYCIYLADDEGWRIIDWCYYEDSAIPVSSKPLAKDGGQKGSYKDVWFTFNSEFSWNQTAIAVPNRISGDATPNLTEAVSSVAKLDALIKR